MCDGTFTRVCCNLIVLCLPGSADLNRPTFTSASLCVILQIQPNASRRLAVYSGALDSIRMHLMLNMQPILTLLLHCSVLQCPAVSLKMICTEPTLQL